MNWLFFAILAPAVYSIVNFTDKYIVEREVIDYRGMPIYGTIMGLIFGTLFWIGSGFPIISTRDTLLVVFTGMLTIWGAALYFKAISDEAASKIIILFQMSPVLTLLLSFLFLKEVISLKQLLGFVLILTSAIGVSLKKQNKISDGFKLSSSFFLILLTDLMWATSNVIFKFVIDINSFSKVVAYESWGLGIGGLLLYLFFPRIRTAFLHSIKTVRKLALGVIFFNEGVFVVGKLLTFLAVSMGPVSLVSVIGSTQVFFGVFYGFVLAKIAPSTFEEDISRKGMLKKLLFATLIFFGIFLVY